MEDIKFYPYDDHGAFSGNYQKAQTFFIADMGVPTSATKTSVLVFAREIIL